MVVLNGADGVTDILGKVMAQGAAGLGVARSLLAKTAVGDRSASKNGNVPTEHPTVPDGDLH